MMMLRWVFSLVLCACMIAGPIAHAAVPDETQPFFDLDERPTSPVACLTESGDYGAAKPSCQNLAGSKLGEHRCQGYLTPSMSALSFSRRLHRDCYSQMVGPFEFEIQQAPILDPPRAVHGS